MRLLMKSSFVLVFAVTNLFCGVLANPTQHNSNGDQFKNQAKESISEPTTAPASLVTKLASTSIQKGCFVGEKRFFEGQYMPGVGGECKHCYCLRGRRQCTEMRCPDAPRSDCIPVRVEGRCCPVEFNCDKIDQESKTIDIINDASENSFNDFRNFKEHDLPLSRYHSKNNYFTEGLNHNHVRVERQTQADILNNTEGEQTTENSVVDETTVSELDMDIIKMSKADDTMDTEPKISEKTNNKDMFLKEKNSSLLLNKETNNLSNSSNQIQNLSMPDTQNLDLKRPNLSIIDLLLKVGGSSNQNNQSLLDFLPDPIKGTQNEGIESPDHIMDLENKPPEFLSYNINVGTSLRTKSEESPIGVGQIIPVDLNTAGNTRRPSTPALQKLPPQKNNMKEPSLLDSFLNLFAPTNREKIHQQQFRPIPPPPPPLTFNRPPPLRPSVEINEHNIFKERIDSDVKPEIEEKTDIEENSVPLINEEKITEVQKIPLKTRNELPIRRRPSTAVERPRPSILSGRPNFGIPPKRFNTNITLPSNIFVEDDFKAMKPIIHEEVKKQDTLSEPTLPPSLPNLQIIPFVAADALVNQGSPPDDGKTGFSPKPFGHMQLEDCREGGKTWKNGQVVAKRENDPCVICRCLSGKVICQRKECSAVPDGCTAEKRLDGECCPFINCDKAANVSIVDVLPRFHRIENEKQESQSKPIRPAPFAYKNISPPFISSTGEPKLRNPIIRKPFVPTRRSRPEKQANRPKLPKVNKDSQDDETSSKPSPPRISIRPSIFRPPSNKNIPRPSVRPGQQSHSKPFSKYQNLGSRPPFIPPRRHQTSTRPRPTRPPKRTTPVKITTPKPTTTTTTSTTTSIPSTKPVTSIDQTSSLPTIKPVPTIPVEGSLSFATRKPARKHTGGFFESLFSGIGLIRPEIPRPRPKIPRPTIPRKEIISATGKPFILPPDLLLPRPLPPSNIKLDDDDIINFVHQGKPPIPPAVVENVFSKHSIRPSFVPPKPIVKPLPEIPNEVISQVPLGNDPILVSGMFELGGCNVYGRMFKIGADIHEISGPCKACRCTKVGVQCLPIC